MKREAHIVFFYQHFWPDSPPYANMLRVIGRGLSEAGHAVSMVAAQPSYKASDRASRSAARERIDGIDVTRLAPLPFADRVTPVRLLGKVLFPLRALVVLLVRRVRGERPDIVVAATIPPVLNGLLGLAAARLVGARFVYHLQDVYPEIGAAGDLWPESSWRHRLLRQLDTFTTRRADRCVVLSEDMAAALAIRGVHRSRVRVINNFMLETFDGDTEDAAAVDEDEAQVIRPRRRIVFAGNLGRFQALEELLAAFLDHASEHDDLELHFLGDGTAKAALQRQAAESPLVNFHGHVDFTLASRFIKGCDAGIVSIGEGIYRYAYPSKTLTYLGLGVPLFVVVEGESMLAADVRSRALGVVCAERSPEGLRRGFRALAAWLDAHPEASDTVAAHTASNLSSEAAVDHWQTAVAGLLELDPSAGDRLEARR